MTSDALGAGEGIRTPDLLITSELLYRLSYPGEGRESIRASLRSNPGVATADAPAAMTRWD
jgi:hypothetical protein